MFESSELFTMTDSERNKQHSLDRKLSELSISAIVLVIRGTPGPWNAKVHNPRYFFHTSTNFRNVVREAAHVQEHALADLCSIPYPKWSRMLCSIQMANILHVQHFVIIIRQELLFVMTPKSLRTRNNMRKSIMPLGVLHVSPGPGIQFFVF